jgi:hypothetical protein
MLIVIVRIVFLFKKVVPSNLIMMHKHLPNLTMQDVQELQHKLTKMQIEKWKIFALIKFRQKE